MYKSKLINVIIPAYNEEQSIHKVIVDLLSLQESNGHPLIDNIIVADNASTDATHLIAKEAGATVVHEPQLGYGSACLRAIKSIEQCDIVVFVDGDASVYVPDIFTLLNQLIPHEKSIKPAADLVIGTRIRSKQETGSLLPQQKLGNLLATRLISWLWSSPVTDLGPFRAITYNALKHLNMTDRRYGWTTEMQVKAIQQGLLTVEQSVSTQKRLGHSKISGTFKGTVLAAYDIFSTIFKLWIKEKSFISYSAKKPQQ